MATAAKTAPLFPSMRFVMAVLLHTAMLISLMIRFNIGIAFLCMVADPADNTTALQAASNASTFSDAASAAPEGSSDGGAVLTLANEKEFSWSKSYQGWIVSAYFYGFVGFLIPGGLLVDRFGAHHMLRLGTLVGGVVCLVIPELTRLHSGLLIASRVLLGASNAMVIPSIPALSRHWSLTGEYTTIFAIAWAGFYTGTAVSFPLGSALCSTDWGWPGIFYTSGIISMVWMVLSMLLVQNDPLQSRWVRGRERESFQHIRDTASNSSGKVASVPLLKILTNYQVWNVAIAFFIGLWNLYSSTIAMPQFMKNFMQFDLASNGAISAAPHLLLAVFSIVTGKLFSYLISEKGVSKTVCRKGFNFIANFIPAFLMLAAVLLPFEQRTAAVVCLVLGIGLTAPVFTGGPFSGAADIGAQYTGTVFSIAASIGNIPGFVIPPVLAAMTANDTRDEWVHFVAISVAAHLFSSVYQAVFWKSEVQPFADAAPQRQTKEEETSDLSAL